jgi:glycosyltransferase involved in cell wall biosynthesis
LALRHTVGKNRIAWRAARRVHHRLIGHREPEQWTRSPTERGVKGRLNERPFGVNLAGYLTSEKGTGQAARSAAEILHAAGMPLALNSVIDSDSANRERPVVPPMDENPYVFNLIYVNGDQAANFAFHKGRPYFAGRYNIGAWNWELTRFPEEWLSRFQYFDEVWVGTNFVKDALQSISPIPVTTVPYAVEPPPIAKLSRRDFGLSESDFVFLFMFDFYSVVERKNPFGLIEAFKRAFRPDEPATLVIKVSHSDKRTLRLLTEAARGAKILVWHTILGRAEIGSLYQVADCYVSLHRSEGFGLTPAEAMALGKPVIATAYGGNMDFMSEDNSYLVRYSLIELDRDYTPYQKGWVWADPSLDHAADLMRAVYENRDTAASVGKRAAEDISELLGAEAVGRAMTGRLEAIARDMGIAMTPSRSSTVKVNLKRREAT